MKNCGERYAACGVLGLAVSISASAQDAISFLNEANSQMYSGDQESAQKALGWCGGMVFCIIAALVLKNFIGL